MSIARALFVAEGSSDTPIGGHIEDIAFDRGIEVQVSAPDLSRLSPPVGARVVDKIARALDLSPDCRLILVHRDADGSDFAPRVAEIHQAVAAVRPDLRHVAIVPVRMTESWLVVDEQAIRAVAGNPGGRMPLGLPSPTRAEAVADPKALLRAALSAASGHSGRRLRDFARDFCHHRRQLIERLDRTGPVAQPPSWQRFVGDVGKALDTLG